MLNTGVEGADFDTNTSRWNVRLSTGDVIDCKFFVLCTGFAAKRHIPNFNGLDRYKGIMHHTGQNSFPGNLDSALTSPSCIPTRRN